MKSSETTHYSRFFSGNIWKLKADPFYKNIWIETRDEMTLTTDYFIIHLESSSDQQIILDQPFSWWESIAFGIGNILIINRIEDKHNPGKGTIRVIDTLDGSEKWTAKEVIFDGVIKHSMLYHTGDKYQSQLKLDLAPWLVQNKSKPFSLLNPSIFPEEHPYHKTASDFLKSNCIACVGPVGYLEVDHHIIMSYHQRQNERLTQSLIWMKQGQIMYHAVIDQKMSGYAQESFIIMGSYLIIVVDRKQLMIHLLA